MSRYDEDCDYDGNYPYQLYEANLERAFRGRKGRQFLAELREALLALPQPRLIEGAMCTVGPEARVETWMKGQGAGWPGSYREELTEIVTDQGEGETRTFAAAGEQR